MHLNYINDNIVKVEATKDNNAMRSVPVESTQRLKLGSICGVEKEYTIAVDYVVDDKSKKLIIVSTSNYATHYRSMIGRMFETVEKMEKACLRVYTPPYRD